MLDALISDLSMEKAAEKVNEYPQMKLKHFFKFLSFTFPS